MLLVLAHLGLLHKGLLKGLFCISVTEGYRQQWLNQSTRQLYYCFVVEDLSYLTITSKAIRNFVELYRNTELARRLLLKPPLSHCDVPASERCVYYEQFRKYGEWYLCRIIFCCHTSIAQQHDYGRPVIIAMFCDIGVGLEFGQGLDLCS